jgi:hypothetical protein
MKKFIFYFLIPCLGLAQDSLKFFEKYPFVHQTEFGLNVGRTLSNYTYFQPWSSYRPIYPDQSVLKNVYNFGFHTFNGIEIAKRTAIGISTGLDAYHSILIMPVGLGIRQLLLEKAENKTKLQFGLDVGWGGVWLNPKNELNSLIGGPMLNPALGLKFPMRNGSSWLLSMGYRYQFYEITQKNPDFFILENTETRNLKRFQLRMGFEW